MATLLAWQDFNDVCGHIRDADGAISALHAQLDWLIAEIEKVTTDTDRRNAATELANIHPEYTLAYIQARLANIKTLRNWMVANGY